MSTKFGYGDGFGGGGCDCPDCVCGTATYDVGNANTYYIDGYSPSFFSICDGSCINCTETDPPVTYVWDGSFPNQVAGVVWDPAPPENTGLFDTGCWGSGTRSPLLNWFNGCFFLTILCEVDGGGQQILFYGKKDSGSTPAGVYTAIDSGCSGYTTITIV